MTSKRERYPHMKNKTIRKDLDKYLPVYTPDDYGLVYQAATQQFELSDCSFATIH